ncbi:DMT family transporter [Nonomuraea sp. NPDC005983]|uniref:DMT family transporter n=1 Tax=Nonomuraea sp. NPDC005983 TaxID=3155595 RepID=UPI0033AAC0CC
MIATEVLVLMAAALLGLGFVAQQHAAYAEPLGEVLHVSLLLHLARKPLWLFGIGAMVGGQILASLALQEANVTQVAPLLATNLIFALALAAVRYQEFLGRAEWLGAVLVSGGVAVFLASGQPHGGDLSGPAAVAWMAAAGVLALAGVLVVLALRTGLKTKAMLLAAAAGALYGLQDALTRGSLLTLEHGPRALFGSWYLYTLPVIAVTGIWLNQSAFDAAPLRISLPTATATEPIIGIVLGVAIFRERLRVDPQALVGEVVGLVALVVGIVILGRSPFLAKSEQGPQQPDSQRQ